jgi:hypothetical protein
MTVYVSLKNTFQLACATIVAVALVFLGTTIPAHAQANTSQNVTVSPATTLISLKAGQTVEKTLQILNSGGDAYSVTTEPFPYSVKGLEYSPQFTQVPGTTETTSWIKILSPPATITPQKSTTIAYTVTVPVGTAPGGYYAVLFAETQPISQTPGTGIVPRNRVGNILYITVEGPVEMSGTVTADHIGGFRYQPNIPVGFKVSNTGGVHFQTTAKISIKSITGKELHNASVDRYVLPQTQREISVDWAPPAPVGIYTVSRSAIVAGTNRTLPDERIIYIQPWVIIFAGILIISIILFFATQASGRRKAKSEKTEKVVKTKK